MRARRPFNEYCLRGPLGCFPFSGGLANRTSLSLSAATSCTSLSLPSADDPPEDAPFDGRISAELPTSFTSLSLASLEEPPCGERSISVEDVLISFTSLSLPESTRPPTSRMS